MSEFGDLESKFLSTIVAYQANETDTTTDAILGTMAGDEVTFIVESDYDTLYFRIGVPLGAFDGEGPRQNLMHVKHLGGATTDLQRAVLKQLLRKVNLNLTHQSTTATRAVYGDSMPLVVDETTV